jgi:hypothetical protein
MATKTKTRPKPTKTTRTTKATKARPTVEETPLDGRQSAIAEAPDAGDQDPRHLEASETRDRQGRHAEAPDAGDGRAHYLESDYTHGRSQS